MDREHLAAELIRDEAVRLKPYRCTAGKLTIGVGRNLDDLGISRVEAEYLLRNDIARVEAELDVAIPWWRSLDEVRQRVLANMAFNMGLEKFLTFRNTLDLVRRGQYLDAAQHMLDSRWAKQVGVRAQRLSLMMRDGGPA